MQKDRVILFMVISFLIGFILGAVVGIKYASKELSGPSAEGIPPASPAPKPVSREEISVFENALKTDPNNLNALISLGNLYFDGNQHQKAIDMYERALKIDPKNADVRTDMAIMYRGLKDYDRSVKEFKRAAADSPKHANSRLNLGIVLLHDKKDFKGAIAAWEDLLKVEPTGERADKIRQQLDQLRTLAK